MTLPQLGVLGLMFLCLIGILSAGYAGLNMIVASAYKPSGLTTLGPTAIPLDTPTPGPTLTPFPSPTFTAVPYEALIPAGWAEYASAAEPGLKIYLPASYVPLKDKDQVLQVTIFDANNDDVRTVLALRDTTVSPYLVFTRMFIANQPIRTTDLDETVDNVFASLKRAAILIDRDEIEIYRLPARKVVFDVKTAGGEAGLVMYVLQLDGKNWFIGFVTPYNELYSYMPLFDQAAQTFWYVRPTPTPSPTPTVPTATNTPLP
jgi:hypothetical protein